MKPNPVVESEQPDEVSPTDSPVLSSDEVLDEVTQRATYLLGLATFFSCYDERVCEDS